MLEANGVISGVLTVSGEASFTNENLISREAMLSQVSAGRVIFTSTVLALFVKRGALFCLGQLHARCSLARAYFGARPEILFY